MTLVSTQTHRHGSDLTHRMERKIFPNIISKSFVRLKSWKILGKILPEAIFGDFERHFGENILHLQTKKKKAEKFGCHWHYDLWFNVMTDVLILLNCISFLNLLSPSGKNFSVHFSSRSFVWSENFWLERFFRVSSVCLSGKIFILKWYWEKFFLPSCA